MINAPIAYAITLIVCFLFAVFSAVTIRPKGRNDLPDERNRDAGA